MIFNCAAKQLVGLPFPGLHRRCRGWPHPREPGRTGRSITGSFKGELSEFVSAYAVARTCYGLIFGKDRHLQGKAHTYTVKSMNNRLRCYLARLRRRTHCYSKSAANLRDSLLFVFGRRLQCPLIPQSTTITCPQLWEEDVSIPI
jgi:insertion element IS1 protein InsB